MVYKILSKKFLFTFLVLASLSGNANAMKFQFENDKTGDQSISLKIRIFLQDKYKQPLLKAKIGEGEIFTVDFQSLVKNIDITSPHSSKKLHITCEPQTQYSYTVLTLLEIPDYCQFDLSKIDEKIFKVKVSINSVLHLVTLNLEK